MVGVEILEAEEGYVFAGFRDVFVVVWRQTIDIVRAARVAEVLERFAAKRPGGIAMFVVIESTCGLPDGETRDRMARDMKAHEHFTKQMLLVYEGTGFGAAAIRSVVVGLQMLSRQAVDTKTVATPAEAARWLESRSGVRASELEAAVDVIRRAKPGA